jgi:hypothetical protein
MLGAPAHAEAINFIVIWREGELSPALSTWLAGAIAVAISVQTLSVLNRQHLAHLTPYPAQLARRFR